MQKKKIISLPFLYSFIGFSSRNRSVTNFSLALTCQFMISPPSTSLIFSKNTTFLAFLDQYLDLSLMFPGPGIPRQSGTASEPSDMLLPLSGMSSPRASRRRTPFTLSDLRWKPPFLYVGMIVNVIVYVRLCWCVCWVKCVCVCVCACVCACTILFSVITICNSVYFYI